MERKERERKEEKLRESEVEKKQRDSILRISYDDQSLNC